MIVHLTGIRRDYLQNTKETFISGKAIRNGSMLSARECPPFSGSDTLLFNADGIVLTHRGETESRVELPFAGEGTAYAETMFGKMQFSAQLIEYAADDSCVQFRYRLMQENETVSEIELTFLISSVINDSFA